MSKDEHGFWVTPTEYSRLTGIPRQTLANWRYQDRQAGRTGPPPGFPIYRRFGPRCMRYYVEPELRRPEASRQARGIDEEKQYASPFKSG